MILILTYGKVCSTSLRAMLESAFPGDVYYTHALGSRLLSVIKDFVQHATVDTSGLWSVFSSNDSLRARLGQAVETGEEVTLIAGVRDPVARSLSVAIQTLPILFPGCICPDPATTARNVANQVANFWLHDSPAGDPARRMAEEAVRGPRYWFAEEIEAPFGFDLRAEPFDFERGYRVLARANVRLLLFRHEDAPRAVEAGLASLFPGREFVLPRRNAAADKPSHEIYQRLKACFRLPEEALRAIYDDPYVRHFYPPAEIEAAIQHWSTARPAASAPQPRYRATVAVTLLNHREWVKQQLESLFAQWRADIDLVVVDDGSTDGSFEAVQQALAARPEIQATVLRNERPLGLDVIAQILRHCRSEVIIQADSDDIALPGRLESILACFDRDPHCRMVTSNAMLISAEGLPIGLYDTQHDDQVLDDPMIGAALMGDVKWLGATTAFHRSVLDGFPPLDTEVCPYGLDLMAPFRATLTGTHHYLATPLVGWRQHGLNSHRVAGTYAASGVLRERYGALKLMVLAQRIRDVAYVQANAPDPAAFEPVLKRCQKLFLTRFTDWSRVRNGMNGKRGEAPESAPDTYVAGVPPIVTLAPGERRHFGLADPLGTAAAAWSGFYPAEATWNWTSDCALLVCRVPAPVPKHLKLAFSGLAYLSSQRVRLSVNGGAWLELVLRAGELVEVCLETGSCGIAGYLTLLIRVADVGVPAQLTAHNADARRLGIMLHWLKLSGSDAV